MFKKIIYLVFLAAAPAWAAAAQKLGADGFPADWKDTDFQIDTTSPSRPVSASATTYRIDQLPRVKSDVVQPVEKPAKTQTPSPTVTLPQVQAEDTPAQPKTLEELNSYGPLSTSFGGSAAWNNATLGNTFAGLDGRRSIAAWVQNDVFRRVLMSRGAPPNPQQTAQTSPTTAVSGGAPVTPTLTLNPPAPWLAQRAQALEKMGFYEAADSLWRAIPADLRLAHPALAEGWVASRLLAGQTGEACQLAANQVLNSGGTAAVSFWRQSVLACQAISGQREALGLSLQLAESAQSHNGPAPDAFLLAVAAAVREDHAVDLKALGKAGVPARIETLPAAILATYPALIQEDWLPRLPDVVWRRLVRTEGLPWRLRTAAAELLAAQTHTPVDVEVVQAFYAVANIEGIDWYDPLGAAEKVLQNGEPVRARAMLWQAANGRAANMGLRALSWQRWAQRASMAGLGSLLPVMSPDTARIKPGPDLAWLAPVAQSLVWQRGESDTGWLKALQQNASVAPELKTETQGLTLLSGLMSGNAQKTDWQNWLALTDKNADKGTWNETERLRAARLLSAATALGQPLPPDLLPQLQQKVGTFAESIAGANPFWVQSVDAAVHVKQTGTALDLLRQLSPGEDPQSPPLLAVRINTLHDLGFEAEARQMAAASLMAPLVSEVAEPPAPKINGGKKPVEKVKKTGVTTIKLPPVSPTTHVTPGGILMPPEKH